MAIVLPKNPVQFRQAFDEICNRIQTSDQDEIFFALFVQLIAHLREQPLLKEVIGSIQAGFKQKQAAFNTAALEVLEYHWKKLWQYHRKSYRHRRELARIKRVITSPCNIECSLLYHRLSFMMFEFRHRSPFFRCLREFPFIFRRAQSDRQTQITLTKHFSSAKGVIITQRELSPKRSNKKNKLLRVAFKQLRLIGSIISSPTNWSKNDSRGRNIEKISCFFSPNASEVDQEAMIRGRNNDEKRRNMQIDAAANFASCWERLHLLEICYHAPSIFPSPKCIQGKWISIRDIAWEKACKRCEYELFVHAKMAFRRNLSSRTDPGENAFLPIEYQIRRKDYEKFLNSLKHHVQAHLYKIENEGNTAEDQDLTLPGTLPEDFVVRTAKTRWKNHPFAKYDEVYDYYLCNCPSQHLLGRERWEQIVRKHKLDPRSKKEKVKRGPGKKTRKN